MIPNKRQRTTLGASASGSADTEIIGRVTKSEDPLRHQLLPGLPNDVTLYHIAPNWSWGTRQVVARVSRDWQRAFQGGMVCKPRVCSPSAEDLKEDLHKIIQDQWRGFDVESLGTYDVYTHDHVLDLGAVGYSAGHAIAEVRAVSL